MITQITELRKMLHDMEISLSQLQARAWQNVDAPVNYEDAASKTFDLVKHLQHAKMYVTSARSYITPLEAMLDQIKYMIENAETRLNKDSFDPINITGATVGAPAMFDKGGTFGNI